MKRGSGDRFFTIDHFLLVTHACIQNSGVCCSRSVQIENELSDFQGLSTTISTFQLSIKNRANLNQIQGLSEPIMGFKNLSDALSTFKHLSSAFSAFQQLSYPIRHFHLLPVYVSSFQCLSVAFRTYQAL